MRSRRAQLPCRCRSKRAATNKSLGPPTCCAPACSRLSQAFPVYWSHADPHARIADMLSLSLALTWWTRESCVQRGELEGLRSTGPCIAGDFLHVVCVRRTIPPNTTKLSVPTLWRSSTCERASVCINESEWLFGPGCPQSSSGDHVQAVITFVGDCRLPGLSNSVLLYCGLQGRGVLGPRQALRGLDEARKRSRNTDQFMCDTSEARGHRSDRRCNWLRVPGEGACKQTSSVSIKVQG